MRYILYTVWDEFGKSFIGIIAGAMLTYALTNKREKNKLKKDIEIKFLYDVEREFDDIEDYFESLTSIIFDIEFGNGNSNIKINNLKQVQEKYGLEFRKIIALYNRRNIILKNLEYDPAPTMELYTDIYNELSYIQAEAKKRDDEQKKMDENLTQAYFKYLNEISILHEKYLKELYTKVFGEI